MTSKYFGLKTHVLPGQYIREYPGATLDNQEDALKLHIKQYIPIEHVESRPKGVTIIGTHANGFPKVGLPQEIRSYLALTAPGIV